MLYVLYAIYIYMCVFLSVCVCVCITASPSISVLNMFHSVMAWFIVYTRLKLILYRKIFVTTYNMQCLVSFYILTKKCPETIQTGWLNCTLACRLHMLWHCWRDWARQARLGTATWPLYGFGYLQVLMKNVMIKNTFDSQQTCTLTLLGVQLTM